MPVKSFFGEEMTKNVVFWTRSPAVGSFFARPYILTAEICPSRLLSPKSCSIKKKVGHHCSISFIKLKIFLPENVFFDNERMGSFNIQFLNIIIFDMKNNKYKIIKKIKKVCNQVIFLLYSKHSLKNLKKKYLSVESLVAFS